MNLKYFVENDLMYIYFEMNVPNIQTKTSHQDIFKFVDKNDKKRVVGFEVESASKNIKYILKNLNLTSKQKLGLCLFFLRERDGKTQKEYCSLLNVSESTYKALEKAEHNISFDTLDEIFEKFPNEGILGTVFEKVG